MRDFKVDLLDGRTVEVARHGNDDGIPVCALHGSPTSNAYWVIVDEPARMRGVRVLAPNRPGIGGSDPHSLPFVASYAEDVAAIADHLGLTRFAVIGHSGGGPFALACAAVLPERLTAAATLAGGAPLDTPGVLDKLGTSDRRILSLLQEGKEASARRRFKLMGAAARYLPWLVLAAMKRSVSSSEKDVLDRVGDAGLFPSRHSILHGRALGYDTRRNSTKALVAIPELATFCQARVLEAVESGTLDEVDRQAFRST